MTQYSYLQNTDPKRVVTLFFYLVFFCISAISPQAVAKQNPLTQLSDATFLVTRSHLIWQNTRSRKIDSFIAMKNYVDAQEIEGWRLPTRQELYQLIEIFDLHQNGSITINIDGSYWLTDDSGKPIIGSWEIGDQCGSSRTYYPHKKGYIRLVREQ